LKPLIVHGGDPPVAALEQRGRCSIVSAANVGLGELGQATDPLRGGRVTGIGVVVVRRLVKVASQITRPAAKNLAQPVTKILGSVAGFEKRTEVRLMPDETGLARRR
jgi:hypothetical protein